MHINSFPSWYSNCKWRKLN